MYVISGINHENSAVTFTFRSSLYSSSRWSIVTYSMGVNVKYEIMGEWSGMEE